MSKTADQVTYEALVTLATLLLVGYGLLLLLRSLGRTRPELTIGVPIATAFALRIMSAGAVSLTSIGDSLRGSDEASYVLAAENISYAPFGSGEWTDPLTHQLHLFLFSLQKWAFDSPDFALRITQVGIAVAGLILLPVAVHELAGPRAAKVAAWFLALEPTNIFFSSVIHKEPNMFLATGLVIYGGAVVWKRGDLRHLPVIAVGCLIAIATRSYAGWFLVAAGAAISLHAGLRPNHRGSARSLSLVAIVVLLIAISAPTVLNATSSESLQKIQGSQTANTSDQGANLSLEQVDFSTRAAVITNLPRRMYDVAFRPYPWQLGSASQKIGVLGTTIAYTIFALLLWYWVRSPRGRLDASAPLIYTLGLLFVAYSLSAGNAGTAFRYRTHLLALTICVLVVISYVRKRVREPTPAAKRSNGREQNVSKRAFGFTA
jgi:hypothetical protein